MVKQCQLCKKLDCVNPGISFHCFPKNQEKRNLWLCLLGLSNNKPLPRYAYICSDHFQQSDIVSSSTGSKKYLKQNALPLPVPVLEKSETSSSDHGSDPTIFETPPRRPVGIPCIPSCSLNSNEGPQLSPIASTSSTLTASEAEEHMVKLIDTDEATNEIVQPKSEFRGILSMIDTSKKRKRTYVGDLSSGDFSTPEKRRKNIGNVKALIKTQRQKIHSLQTTVGALRKKISTLKSLLTYLKKQAYISEASESTIRASVQGPAADMFSNLLKGAKKQKYNPSLRSFALTLSFYSPKAYNFVRTTFNRSLPHPSTISKWFKCIDGSPGFTKEALAALKMKQDESDYPILCNLVMDEMAIRRQVEWTGHKFTGYVDVGTKIDSDSLPMAREALVFMLVCLNGSWKVPVGYFLVDSLEATEKANLIIKCLEFVHETGVTVTSLTFDGTPTNLNTAQKLGADFSNPRNLRTLFKHPVSNHNIFIYLDPSHMIKLVRNCFASHKVLQDSSKRDIKWEYIEKLVQKQNLEGLHAATKLRDRHLQWEREKMRVRLATQTLSKSASDAISFLREDLKDSEFTGSEATSEFLLNFNDLFDIFNSRNRLAKYFFKKPFSPQTFQTISKHMEIMKNYILGLTLNNTPIVKSNRKTGFLGLLICITSLEEMYQVYVYEKKYLKYILTYKLSQDHLELFFGAIRSKGGFNNNPTARQLEASYKRLLVRSQIASPSTGNAMNLENISILTCGSIEITRKDTGDDMEEDDDFLVIQNRIKDDLISLDYLGSDAWDLTIYVEDIVSYISGFLVKGLKKCVTCSKCLSLLESENVYSQLQVQKTYGKLMKASKLVLETCKAGEKFFRFFHKTSNIFNKNIKNLIALLVSNTLQNINVSLFEEFGDHIYEGDVLNNHAIDLLKLTLKQYFNLRIHYESKKENQRFQKPRLRNINTKSILFRNE